MELELSELDRFVAMKIDLRELEEKKERNRKERLKFIELQVDWLKRTPNAVWSKQQVVFIDSVLASAQRSGRGKNAGKMFRFGKPTDADSEKPRYCTVNRKKLLERFLYVS